MKLQLKRMVLTDRSAIGELFVDGKRECYTLEDTVREVDGQPVAAWKIPHETAIPRGTYAVIVNYSQRFKKELPLLLDVPGYSGVRIHSGNKPADTEGCILVGQLVAGRKDWVGNSLITMARLMQKLEAAYDRGEPITLEVV